jgi:guanine deaminase
MTTISTHGRRALTGTLIHTPRRGAVEILDGALIVYREDGLIENVWRPGDENRDEVREEFSRNGRLRVLSNSQYLLPGLVDLHVHAPQWPQLGKALHLPLEKWLLEYTFPLEARYSDVEFADGVYRQLVRNLLSQGTTTAMYFGTIHVDASARLAEVCTAEGQRAYVGRVAMDDATQCPDYYRDRDATAGLEASIDFMERLDGLPQPAGGRRVHGVVTPRFIPACSDRLLTALGDLVAERQCHVQTHCSESDWEHGFVLARCGRTDAASLADFGLLTDRTVLAHCGFIDQADMGLMARQGSSVAHCPLSNSFFANAVFPLRRALDAGVNVGLGTDISGGPSASILDNCCQAVTSSRMLRDGTDPARIAEDRGVPGSHIDFMEAFWLATVGGGRALGAPVGLFSPGYRFDALLVDTDVSGGDVHVFSEADTAEDVFQKIVYHARRRNITGVWVDGKPVI